MNTKKKKLTAIIIAAVAVVLAAVIVVTCVVLRRSDSGNSDTLGGSSKNPPSVTYNPEEGKTVTYEKATFNGYTMPAGFVEVMEAANEISEKECNEKGIALTVGEHEISVSEFAMSYYDTYTNAVYEYSSDTQTTKGLKPTSRPSQLEYAGDVTWKERLEELAIEDVRKKYVLAFDALSQGFEISDEGYEAVAEEFNANYEYVTSEGITENEFMETAYLAPIPYELYQRSYILMKYAEEYYYKDQLHTTSAKEECEFNTDTHPGLPEKPICNPSLNSMAAALGPTTEGGYFYFVYDEDASSHRFASTQSGYNAILKELGLDDE